MIRDPQTGKLAEVLTRDVHFSETEPIIMERLIRAAVFSITVKRTEALQATYYTLNTTAFRSSGSGIVRVNLGDEDSLTEIFFQEVPDTNLYLMAVIGYTKAKALPSCGYLSTQCSSVHQPDVSFPVADLCDWNLLDYQTHAENLTFGPIPDKLLRSIRQRYKHTSGVEDWLDCPRGIPGWGSALMVLLAVVLVLTPITLWMLMKRRRKQLRLAHLEAGRSKPQTPEAEDEDPNLTRRPEAYDFQNLAGRQGQLSEDLWTRENGGADLIKEQVASLTGQLGTITKQMDSLLQRIHKQEACNPRIVHLLRRNSAATEKISKWQKEVNELAESGTGGLDNSIQRDLSEMTESVEGGVLPSGVREAAFHKKFFKKAVQGTYIPDL